MLTQVLEAIRRSEGGVDLRALSRELGVDPSALEGMIAFWVRKGSLVDASSSGDVAPDCAPCAPGCGGDEPCPFVYGVPRIVSAPREEAD